MRGVSALSLLWFLMVAGSCRPTPPEITGVDWQAWKDDRNGCQTRRLQHLDTITAQLDLFKTRSETEIVDLMGRPDETELYKRNQKFYTYFLSGSPACNSPDTLDKKLIIRFNAVGLAKEVALELQGEPFDLIQL